MAEVSPNVSGGLSMCLGRLWTVLSEWGLMAGDSTESQTHVNLDQTTGNSLSVLTAVWPPAEAPAQLVCMCVCCVCVCGFVSMCMSLSFSPPLFFDLLLWAPPPNPIHSAEAPSISVFT